MGQFNKVLYIAIDNEHTVSERAIDCGPDVGGLNLVYGPNWPPSLFRVSVLSISTSLSCISTREIHAIRKPFQHLRGVWCKIFYPSKIN